MTELKTKNLLLHVVSGLVLLGAAAVPVNGRAVDWLEDLPVVGKDKEASATEAGTTSSSVPAVPSAPKIHEARQAMVRILDKQTNRVQTIMLNLKQAREVGTLSVTVNRCLLDSNAKPGLDAAWFEIKDTALPDRGFSGWMFSRYPQSATLDNPRYDVQLASCVLPAGEARIQAAPPPAGAGQGTGGEDVEGGAGDDEAPSGAGNGASNAHGSDPFFVPGVNGNASGTPEAKPEQEDNDNAQVGEPVGVGEPADKPERSEQPARENTGNGADAGVELPTEAQPQRHERGGDQQQLQQMMDNSGGGGQ